MNMSLVSLCCVALLPASDTAGQGRGYPRGDLLMEPSELAQVVQTNRLIVLDVRSQDDYDRGHITGAWRVDHDQWKKAFGDGQDAAGWSRRIGALGIGRESRVVVYDDKQMKDAARIWWILRYWGVEDVRLLNGGWPGWQSAGLPTTREVPAAGKAGSFAAKPRSERLVTMKEILSLLPGKRLEIVDARSGDEHCGIEKRDSKRGGAIPGAKHLEWKDLIVPETSRFRNAQELRPLFAEAGIDLGRPVASHCQSGGRAAVMAFGLELMGSKDVRNYYNGWSEWGNSDKTPIVVPKATAKAR